MLSSAQLLRQRTNSFPPGRSLSAMNSDSTTIRWLASTIVTRTNTILRARRERSGSTARPRAFQALPLPLSTESSLTLSPPRARTGSRLCRLSMKASGVPARIPVKKTSFSDWTDSRFIQNLPTHYLPTYGSSTDN